MIYTIDLATLLQLLGEFDRSGAIDADLPYGISNIREAYHAHIDIERGKIFSCSILSANGIKILSGKEAVDILYKAGVLHWIFTERARTASLPIQPAQVQQLQPSTSLHVGWPIPRRTRPIEANELQTWPRRYRQVLVLIDGQRDIQKIATMLCQTTTSIVEILQELQASGVIVLE